MICERNKADTDESAEHKTGPSGVHRKRRTDENVKLVQEHEFRQKMHQKHRNMRRLICAKYRQRIQVDTTSCSFAAVIAKCYFIYLFIWLFMGSLFYGRPVEILCE